VSRGTSKEIGDHFTNANGYTYEKTEAGWTPLHQVIAEKKLGRPLKPEERAYYIDGNRTNHSEDNVGVKIKYPKQSPQGKLIAINAQIQDLQDQLEELAVQREKLLAEIAR
jgi:hypothetical protein